MRLWIFAVGSARGTAEGALCESYCRRAVRLGHTIGIQAIQVEELAIARARDVRARIADEAARLAARLPDGAQIVLLDAKGKGMTSEEFADMLGALRDAGTRDFAFVIGGPDGLGSLPGKRPGRSLAFGPQTWPHLLARALLCEQVYRAMMILAGHPYHRA